MTIRELQLRSRQTHECAASLGMVFRHNFPIVFATMQMMAAYFFHSSTHIYVFFYVCIENGLFCLRFRDPFIPAGIGLDFLLNQLFFRDMPPRPIFRKSRSRKRNIPRDQCGPSMVIFTKARTSLKNQPQQCRLPFLEGMRLKCRYPAFFASHTQRRK